MASVRLDFTPPEDTGIIALRIYESDAQAGPFTQIERVTQVGSFPGYITSYTTSEAVSEDDWFAIAWEDSSGAVADLSLPIAGGTETWVGEIIKRVLQRDSSQDENIVRQEAEAAIASVGLDPYAQADLTAYRTLTGLTYLTLARTIIASVVVTSASSGSTQSATIGLLSFKNDTSANTAVKTQSDVDKLIELANRELGIFTSVVLQLEEVCRSYGISSYDHSRLIGWVGLE